MNIRSDNDKKQIPLRLSPSLWRELATWAEDDFRSINGQIEYLLTESVRQRRKTHREAPQSDSEGAEPSAADGGDDNG